MQPLWKQHGASFKNEKIELSYDPAILLLGIFPKNTKTQIWKYTCTLMFIQPWYWSKLTVHEWINGQIKCDIHSRGLLLSHNKEWSLATCDNTDGPGGQYAKWSKSGYQRQISYDFTYM